MSIKYPYLRNKDFLMNFFRAPVQEKLIKITVLNFQEKPLKSIEGHVQSGSISINGSSSVRRTANLTVLIEEDAEDLINVEGLFSLNKKVKIEIGLKNHSERYKEHSILWFPQGIYVISSVSFSHSTSGVSLSLQLKDKMVLLNGECGGIISASTVFHEYEILDPSTGNYVIQKPTIVQIIQELVNHFGGEQLGKIIINDIDTRIKRVMKWTKNYPLYRYAVGADNDFYYQYTTEIPPKGTAYDTFKTGEDIGFVYTDFYFPGELIGDAGNSVCTILDTIKNTLGNYEYFYDLDGNFVFQEIKNYLNTTKATLDINNLQQQDYIIDKGKGNAEYVFNDSLIVSSYSSSPQYEMIKNDFVVWGLRESVSGQKLPIRYHLAIDEKPQVGNEYTVCKHRKWNSTTESYTNIYKRPTVFKEAKFPETGEIERYYRYQDADGKYSSVYYWDPENQRERKDDEKAWIPTSKTNYHKAEDNDKMSIETITTKDWRSELFLSGTMATRFGTDSNPYYAELVNEWPKLYNLEEQDYLPEVKNNIDSIDYFLDFIDSTSAISEFNVSNIGRRTKVVNDDKINCIFETEVPDIILLNLGSKAEDLSNARLECKEKGQDYSQVSEVIFQGLAQGGSQNSAYNAVRDLLYQHTQYNESISVQILPLYFLEPNIRITVQDSKTGIHGDYIINSISVPLDISGTMSLSCSKALTRI